MTKLSNSIILIVVTCFWPISYGQEVGKIKSSLSCKECHEAIYTQWSNSRHAHSTPVKNILFANIYELSKKDTGGETKLYCIRCHAPVSQINGDVDLQLDITNEGITCDVCHSITELTDEAEYWPNMYKPGEVKLGARKDAKPEAHTTAYSELFENGRMCSGCHGDMLDIPGTRSCGNLTICDTDFEWQSSTFVAEGKSCEVCHMKRTQDKSAVMGPEREKVYQHDFSGAYSHEKLQEAAKLFMEVEEFGGQIIARIQVINDGAAHLLPTGPPARVILLKVIALNSEGEEIWSNFTDNPSTQDPYGIFHIVFADLSGNIPSMPWLAIRIVKDTRLRPEEKRQLIYKFPSEGVAKVTAKLFYRLAPPTLLDKFEITDEILRKPYLMAQVERSILIK